MAERTHVKITGADYARNMILECLEELRRRLDEERQSAEASTRQAADKEKRKLLRGREQLEKDKGALLNEREQRRH